jgi:hypothetical protein
MTQIDADFLLTPEFWIPDSASFSIWPSALSFDYPAAYNPQPAAWQSFTRPSAISLSSGSCPLSPVIINSGKITSGGKVSHENNNGGQISYFHLPTYHGTTKSKITWPLFCAADIH